MRSHYPSLLGSLLTLITLPAVAPAQHLSATYVGAAPGELRGSAFEGVGDVDGDGVSDLIVGIPGDDTAGLDAGAARLISGADGGVLHEWFGSHAGDQLGWIVSDAGDVDRDGTPDVMVGSPFDNFGAGAVHVFSGASGALHAYVRGLALDDRFATSMDHLGDIDGDGHADWAIGAPGVDDLNPDNGAVYVYHGVDGSLAHILTTQPWAYPGMEYGTFLSGVGDVNGDGFDDVLSSTNLEAYLGGVVYVHSGVDGSLLHRVEGAGCHGICEQVGYGVARIGDMNSDGYADFAFRMIDNNFNTQGRLKIRSGIDGAPLAQHPLPTAGIWEFYGPFASVGDVDGDGVSEVLVTTAPDTYRLRSGATWAVLGTVHPPETGIGFATSLAALGDIDGDDVPDLGFGAPLDDAGGADAGAVYAYSGAAAGPIDTYCQGAPNSAGPGATLAAEGSTSLAAQDLELVATGMPGAQFMLFYYGQAQAAVPLGNGTRCIGTPFFRLPVQAIGAGGEARRTLDVGSLPAAGAIPAGSQWNFQAWYRDPAAGGSGFNLSGAIAVPFRP